MSSEHEVYHSGIAQILKVPVELLRMSKEDIKTFVKNYKQGSTKLYCGRGMVVGCFGAGKTTLVKKLKGDLSETKSTRGLEVHTNIFIVDEDETGLTVNVDQESGQRLNICMESRSDKWSSIVQLSNRETQPVAETHPAESKKGFEVHANISTENEDKLCLPENKDQNSQERCQKHSETLTSGVAKTSLNADSTNVKADAEIPATTVPGAITNRQQHVTKPENELNFPSPKTLSGFNSGKSDKTGRGSVKHSVIEQITENGVNKTEATPQHAILPNVSDKPVKTISLLDFAGQGAYYACHHIFLSPRTFYILVTNMSKLLSETPTEDPQTGDLMYGGWTYQAYINHWLGSIHTYSSETAPVILVLSHSERKEKKEKNIYFQNVKKGLTRVLQKHLSLDRTFAIEKDSEKNMKEIKTCMLSIVKDQSHWGESIPTSWVHLEAYLMEIKNKQKVVKKKDLWKTLPPQIKMGIPSEEDMTTALKLFNDVGVILYTSSSESIILDVQWFVDAFKIIITDENHAELDIKNNFNEWIEFSKNGILSKDLVKEIWIGSKSFTTYTEDLLLHMIRLGMIAKMEKEEKYYVPCMNKQKYDKDVLRNCTCSSTICFMFEYLPLVIFHRLIATCMTKDGWKIWNGNNVEKTGQTSECVFHTAAMLEDKGELKMLIGIAEKKKDLTNKENTRPYSIEIQGFVFKDQEIQKQFPQRKLQRIKKHLDELTSCFEANHSMTYRIGYRCSIVPFSDTPDSHIILESAKECTPCRKTEGIDDLKSFWMADATPESNTSKVSSILSDSGLVYVATRLGAEWSLVVSLLGFKQAEIEQIQLDNPHNVRTQISFALRKWRDRRGDQTKQTLLQQLFGALETCDRTDLVDEIHQKYNLQEDKYLAESEPDGKDRTGDEEKETEKESGDTELAQAGKGGMKEDKDLAESEPDSENKSGDEEEKIEKGSGDTELAQAGEDGMEGQMERPFLDEARFTADIHTGYDLLYSVSCVSEERVWTCSQSNNTMKLLTVEGQLLSSVPTKSGNVPYDITVTREGDLVYIDLGNNTINLVKNNKIHTLITLQGWRPLNVCCTAANHLLVTMLSVDKQSKVVRYSGSTETQTIQYDDQGRPLYSSDYNEKYISENRNLDICVADWSAKAVVVVNQSGTLRFRYTGHPSNTGPSFNPVGIATDSQSHILIADWGKTGRIHILDQDGQFLRYIHNLRRPWGLCVDSRDNLFVAEWRTAKVKRIQYLESQC